MPKINHKVEKRLHKIYKTMTGKNYYNIVNSIYINIPEKPDGSSIYLVHTFLDSNWAPDLYIYARKGTDLLKGKLYASRVKQVCINTELQAQEKDNVVYIFR